MLEYGLIRWQTGSEGRTTVGCVRRREVSTVWRKGREISTAMAIVALILWGATVFLGCDPGEEIRPGILQLQGESTEGVVFAPSSALAGKPFVVEIRTHGNDCYRAHHIDVALEEGGAVMRPYDSRVIGQACRDRIRRPVHSVSLTFSDPGTKTLIVEGLHRSRDEDGEPIEEPMTIQVPVLVQ
jgi:hypothetical protein